MVNINRARFLIGNVDYNLRVSNRARNVTLKVNRANGLIVVVPKDFDHQLLPDILNSREGWISRQLERFEALPGRFEQDWPPSRLQLRAAAQDVNLEYRKITGDRIRLSQHQDEVTIELPDEYSNEKLVELLVRWLKKRALQHCENVASELSAITGLKYQKIAVRGQKTRWGSYSSRGTLSLNYKLLFLPEHLLRHIILHELSHSLHMNHSADFWKLLESVDPDARACDKQLSEAWKYLPSWLD